MDLASAPLEDMVLPGLEDARYLGLHTLAGIEERPHGIDQVIELLQLAHEQFLWQELNPLFAFVELRLAPLSVRDRLYEVFQAEHSPDVAVHEAGDALNLIAQIREYFAISYPTCRESR